MYNNHPSMVALDSPHVREIARLPSGYLCCMLRMFRQSLRMTFFFWA